jgi:cytochrome c nitrite reductase small subunit
VTRRRRIAGAGAGAFLGVAFGVGAYTFVYAKGASYLGDDAEACMNCHVMRDSFASWERSSHHAVAVCNDCHTPPGFFRKYAEKARAGLFDSVAFTSGRYADPIEISEKSARLAERACRKCHAEFLASVDRTHAESDEMSCISCHRSAGHLR